MSELQDPAYLAGGCITAQGDRQVLSSLVCAEGVAFSASAGGDLAVTERGAGANMSVDVASGNAFIQGTVVGWQGMYHVSNDAVENVVISAADPTNPRIDLIVATVRDAQYAGAVDDWSLDVVAGTPAPAPVAPAIPDNSLVLAQVAVAASAASIVDADITDTRVPYTACTGDGEPTVVTYSSDDTFDPATYPSLRFIFVRVQAAGGGGGGAGATAFSTGSGGWGGCYAEGFIASADLTAPVAVTVGTGGPGGGGAANGSPGGNSEFGAFIDAGGGAGGLFNSGAGVSAVNEVAPPGSACATGTRVDLAIPGTFGSAGWGATPIAYGGGGGAAHLGAGAPSVAAEDPAGAAPGIAGLAAGGGGGGAANAGGGNQTGGDGADGLVEVWIYA